MAKGCDYAWDRPNLGTLHAAGMEFVCRYFGYDNTGKNLTAPEAAAIKANGMNIVSNFEYAERGALNGRAQGVSDAATGINQHVAVGGPSGRPIYFSVDFDAQDSDMRAIGQYFDGVAATIGLDRTGVYGGIRVCDYMWATGRVKWLWQTSAWSNGVWHMEAHIIQNEYNVLIGGGRVDVDQALKADYGGWGGAPQGPSAPGGDPGGWDPANLIWQLGDRLQDVGNWAANSATMIDSLFT